MKILIMIALLLLASPAFAVGELKCVWPADCGGGGEFVDADGNNRYEQAGIKDWDGDGSTYVTCTGKDAPLPQCKWNGQIIYPDLADDLACAIPNFDDTPRCGHTVPPLERGATVNLRPVTYVHFPCWDITEWQNDPATPTGIADPANANDPRAAANRDSVDDAGYGHCPTDQSGAILVSTNLISSIKVHGAGEERRTWDEITASGYQNGTIIATDWGPALEQYWFSFGPGGIEGSFSMGLPIYACKDSGCITRQGESAMGDNMNGTGWGTLLGPIDPLTYRGNMEVCDAEGGVCGNRPGSSPPVLANASAANWTAGLTKGDRCVAQYPVRGDSTQYVFTEFTVDKVTDNGNTATVEMGFVEETGQANSDQGFGYLTGPIDCDVDCFLACPGPEYFENRSEIVNLTIKPQDPLGEVTGDCDHVFVKGSFSGTGDSVTNFNCDTNYLVELEGGGKNRVQDVTVSEWGAYALDAKGGSGTIEVNNVTGAHGIGGSSVGDFGYGVVVRGLTVEHSYFQSSVVATFSPRFDLTDVLVKDSYFTYFLNMTDQTFSNVERLTFVNNTFSTALVVQCGVQNSRFLDIKSSGRSGRDAGLTQFPLVNVTCNDPTSPVQGNIFRDVFEDPRGWNLAGGGTAPARITNSGVEGGVVNNIFQNFRNYTADTDSVVFALGSGDNAAEIMRNNSFIGNVAAGGRLFAKCSGQTCTTHVDGGSCINGAGNLVTDPLFPIKHCATRLYTTTAMTPGCDTTGAPGVDEVYPGDVVQITYDTSPGTCTQTGPVSDVYSLSGSGTDTSYCQCTSASGWSGF